jgi:hypothetical protein
VPEAVLELGLGPEAEVLLGAGDIEAAKELAVEAN